MVGLIGSSLCLVFECSDAAGLTLNPIGLDLGSWPRGGIDLNLYLEPSSAQRRRGALDQVQLRRPIPAPADSPSPERTKPPPPQCFQRLVRTIAARRPLYQGPFGRTM
ncbi:MULTISPECIES: hypothetical protein [Rhodococcus]|uniref:hypothetical protein n=1 Tax=Rhodococcus TaxID=1827 RepID=UPI002954DB10|nr:MULTISPECIES: hypothetical protein [Rhodococcus]MDV7246300.1 hypothetical protein [Rhodococcus oxybenzonivorans]MDV7337228.1 hypothetical protein [Rhodococcus oxybenzonivorans]MDV8030832.1 hypothetical protein [Rhodococcus sp. IEGM 27]